MTPLPAPIVGVVQHVVDGDTFDIGATRIRLRAIDANELHGGCHNACAPKSAIAARDNLARLALGKVATCRVTGISYDRRVAWCSVSTSMGNPIDLSCAQYRGGYAVRWAAYDRKRDLCR